MDRATRRFVHGRAEGRCEYCRLPQRPDGPSFHVEHVVAKQHGGEDDAGNLALSCHRCNLHKGPNLAGLDPQGRLMVRLFHPRQDAWDVHFAVVGVEIRGRTSVGRATADVLSMNATHRLALRAELLATGQWP